MLIGGLAKTLLRRFGFEVVRTPELAALRRQRCSFVFVQRRLALLAHHGIDLLLDVGANRGQYAGTMRGRGYTGRIVSFEPVASAFAGLSARAEGDPDWRVENYALGDTPGRGRINVSANSCSSSLLEMLPEHARVAPDSVYVGEEEIEIRTLDEVFAGGFPPGARPFLKLDTQGFERKVLEGARSILDSILGVQIEMSLVPLYRGGALLPEMLDYLQERGFLLELLEPGFSDPQSGRLLQVDGVFFRE
jgi:FkbM family methyltransferase